MNKNERMRTDREIDLVARHVEAAASLAILQGWTRENFLEMAMSCFDYRQRCLRELIIDEQRPGRA